MNFEKITKIEYCVFHCNIDGNVYVKMGEMIFSKDDMEEALANVHDDFDRKMGKANYSDLWNISEFGVHIDDWMEGMIEIYKSDNKEESE